jgi:hypothetical protein
MLPSVLQEKREQEEYEAEGYDTDQMLQREQEETRPTLVSQLLTLGLTARRFLA